MPTIASKCRSSFGTDCVQCGNELIAPERSEYRAEWVVFESNRVIGGARNRLPEREL